MGPSDERQLTFGEQLVGVTFNPSGIASVNRLKEIFAEAADIVVNNNNDGRLENDLTRLIDNAALESILAAQMMAVKSVTLGL